jgi:hypothetical protein
MRHCHNLSAIVGILRVRFVPSFFGIKISVGFDVSKSWYVVGEFSLLEIAP